MRAAWMFDGSRKVVERRAVRIEQTKEPVPRKTTGATLGFAHELPASADVRACLLLRQASRMP